MSAISFTRYRNKATKEIVTAMKYSNILDFPALCAFIGDIYPTLNKAHTRVYEGNWIVRHANNAVEFICCAHGEDCFESRFEIFK